VYSPTTAATFAVPAVGVSTTTQRFLNFMGTPIVITTPIQATSTGATISTAGTVTSTGGAVTTLGLQACNQAVGTAVAGNVAVFIGTTCNLASVTIGACPATFVASSLPTYNLTYTVFQRLFTGAAGAGRADALGQGYWFFNAKDLAITEVMNVPEASSTVAALTAWNGPTPSPAIAGDAVVSPAGTAAVQAFFTATTATATVTFQYLRYTATVGSGAVVAGASETYQLTASTATANCATCQTAVMNSNGPITVGNSNVPAQNTNGGFWVFGQTDRAVANTAVQAGATINILGCTSGPAPTAPAIQAYACVASANTVSFGGASTTAAQAAGQPQIATLVTASQSQTLGCTNLGATLNMQLTPAVTTLATTIADSGTVRNPYIMFMLQPSGTTGGLIAERVMAPQTPSAATGVAAIPAAPGASITIPTAWTGLTVVAQGFICQNGLATATSTTGMCRSGTPNAAVTTTQIFPGTQVNDATVGVVSTNAYKIPICAAPGRRLKML
jgi:hypothetical protein